MVVHRGKDLPIAVLANNTYGNSWDAVKNVYGASNVSLRDNSDARFAKACKMVKEFQDQSLSIPVVDYSFKILNEVSQGDHTKWSIVYDLVAKKIYFKTLKYTQVKSVDFSAFDFSCTASAKAFDMNQASSGDVNNSFMNYTSDFNRKITEATAKDSRREVYIKKEETEAMLEYAKGVKCK